VITLRSEEPKTLRELIRSLCGIEVGEDKDYFIESRLSPVAESAGCSTFAELAVQARVADRDAIREEIIDAITTQETLFFRDGAPFEALQHKVLPDLFDRKAATAFGTLPKRVRVWSAGCSTGQEPYSIAMAVRELLPNMDGWDVRILGTDVSARAIDRASRGRFTQFEIDRGMRPSLLNKYMKQRGNEWWIRDGIRGLLEFAKQNLLEPFSHDGKFDIVFCRNVAIYFSEKERSSLLDRLSDSLDAEGYLFLGSAESLATERSQLVRREYLRTTYYQKAEGATAAGTSTEETSGSALDNSEYCSPEGDTTDALPPFGGAQRQ